MNAEGDLPFYESSHYLQAWSLLNLQLVHSADDATSTGFEIYSSVPDPILHEEQRGFTSDQLVHVLRLLREKDPVAWELDYFGLCREMGATVVNALVRSRILELRWSPAPTIEGRHPHRRPFKGRASVIHFGGINAETYMSKAAVLLPATPVIAKAMENLLLELEDKQNSRQ